MSTAVPHLCRKQRALRLLHRRVKPKAPVDLHAACCYTQRLSMPGAQTATSMTSHTSPACKNGNGLSAPARCRCQSALHAPVSLANGGQGCVCDAPALTFQVTSAPTWECQQRCTARSAARTPPGWRWQRRCHLHGRAWSSLPSAAPLANRCPWSQKQGSQQVPQGQLMCHNEPMSI